MRQWELIGITDTMPAWTPPPRATGFDEIVQTVVDRSVFFWTTDAELHLLTVTEAAAEHLGRTTTDCEGRHLAELVGGDGGEVLDAHIAALNGRTATCWLEVDEGTVRCRVAPTKDADGGVIGTYCLAVSWDVDLSEREPLLASVA